MGFSVNDLYLLGPPCVFIACPLVSSVVDQLIIMSFPRYLKPSANSGGSHSNLGLLLDPSGESASAVVASANKQVISVLSGTTTRKRSSNYHRYDPETKA